MYILPNVRIEQIRKFLLYSFPKILCRNEEDGGRYVARRSRKMGERK
jgi:hypothetical protein